MIGWLGLALGAPLVQAERIDVFSESTSAWWLDDAPRLTTTPRVTALRWLGGVQAVARMPRGVVLGASLSFQSIGIRRPLEVRGLFVGAHLHTRLGLPAAATVGVEAWRGPVRLGLAVLVDSGATWARPVADGWRALPAVGVGFGRAPRHE